MSNALQTLPMALSALMRNRTQAALAILGVMIGVAALVTSLALGRGAQNALSEQLLAAGANVIVIRSGNYQMRRDPGPDPEANIGHAAYQDDAERARVQLATFRPDDWRGERGLLWRTHAEDDPLESHDHPLARERLGDMAAGLGSAATLTREDARLIGATIDGVQYVVSGVHENARVFVDGSADKKQWFTRLHGTEPNLPNVRAGWVMTHGRFINDKDLADSAQVMVLGRVVADRLFGEGVDPVGRGLTLWNQPFKVVGVVGSRSWTTQPAPGDDQFDAVYVPVSTVDRLLNLSKLNTVTVTTRSVGDTSRVSEEITKLLRARHDIGEKDPDDFVVTTMAKQALGKGLPPDLARAVTGNVERVDELTVEQLSGSLTRANRTMLVMLASVAAVSLLVGGIGVMNLLLLSVTQRTREVGLRIALGARRSDIASQFVLEAVVLSLIGGVLGILIGVLASGGLERIFQWTAVVSPLAAAAAVVVAVLLGIVSGVYPARRAAGLDPIEALRHE
ncbi:MAG: ABC transporter permease [Polymorphobacter sp.]|uniref:ABC transporter permease n=1 Tax=Polymorphobacter sp. TaxID=1909290 RepID=UPI003A839D08